ncbi:MAG: hypothetical protein MOIL_00467 [Candidatus Methanolliviera sp. GoM_oil]|nr:MAG: hypothetical protein MOIL_00467 [Candidatus Methanolliviera sp. GoM_oil]
MKSKIGIVTLFTKSFRVIQIPIGMLMINATLVAIKTNTKVFINSGHKFKS